MRYLYIEKDIQQCSGIFELSPLLQTSVNVPAMNLSPSSAEELSPTTERNLARLRQAGQGVRHWLVVGEYDSPAFKLQARQVQSFTLLCKLSF